MPVACSVIFETFSLCVFKELKTVLSKDFFEVISSLKTKNPKIYNPQVEFFKNEKSKGDLDPLERLRKRKEEKDKPVFLRDYERKLITERGGELSDDGNEICLRISIYMLFSDFIIHFWMLKYGKYEPVCGKHCFSIILSLSRK